MKLFFDTETTGKANLLGNFNDPNQPRIVQLGALLTDDDGTERGSLNVVIKPHRWKIQKEAAKIHGITTDIAERCGVKLAPALALFSNLLARANELVAHDIDLNLFVTRCALYRIAGTHKGAETCNARLDATPMYCTMRGAFDACRLPGQDGFKWPKLTEAHKQFFGVELEGAHDVMTDLRACKRIYFELMKEKSHHPQGVTP